MERLTALIHEHGLAEHQNELLASVGSGIFLKLGQVGQGKIGQSRIGGTPDSPLTVPWTQSDRCSYLCFLLEINFAEMPTSPGSPLPTQGMLYLFADENENSANQVVLYTGHERLQPAQLPKNASFITDWYDDLVVHRLEFELFSDLPRWATNDFCAFCDRLNLEDELQLDELCSALAQHSIGKLLGYVSGIGHDPREDAYVVREVNPAWLYDYEQRRALDMAPTQNWRNLLAIDSSHSINLMFGDAGYLQVLIHSEDLQRQDFSNVYVNLESS